MQSGIKVAIIGYGHLGKWHAAKVQTNGMAKLHAIVESFEPNQKLAKSAHPEALIVSDIQEIINDIDAAFVVTPTSTHYELVKYLLENNKHVFCEKPLTDTLEQANEILALAKSKELILQVGHSERFHEAWDILKNYPDFLKAPLTVRIARYAAFKGRATDVDVVGDVMIHDMDLMVYLLKEKPTEVIASGQKIRTPKWDHALANFSFASGSYVSIVSSRNHVKEVREVEIFSNAGCLYVDLMSCEIAIAPNSKTTSGEYVEKFQYNKRDHLQLEHNIFYETIMTKGTPAVTVDDGHQAVKMIDAVLKSLNSKEKVSLS